MLALVVLQHPNRAHPQQGQEPVHCLARHGATILGAGASDKAGAVQLNLSGRTAMDGRVSAI